MNEDKFIVGGYQADIDSTDRYSGILYEERGRRILAERGQSVKIGADGEKSVVGSLGDREALQARIRKQDWNEYRIVAQGNQVQHYINGVLMSEVEDGQKAPRKGVIALQLHQGPPMVIQFKNIRIKQN